MNSRFTFETSHSTNLLVITADKNDFPVGTAKVIKHADSWKLADIKVMNFKRISFWRKLCSLGQFKNYRNQGIGSDLLRILISEAQKNGISTITGEIVGEHPENLKQWYSRFGFIVDSQYRIELKID
mgnify:CR=1 FL=1